MNRSHASYKFQRWCIQVVLSIVGVLMVLALLALFASVARAAPAPRIPEYSALYRIKLEREVASVWGVDAPVAGIAAQIHQESRWRADAASPYAHGLMQFTPATSEWIATVFPECAPVDLLDADWSIRCGVRYDRMLYLRAPGKTECDRWAFALSDYNGGAKWRIRDQRLAKHAGADSSVWFDAVELHRSRGAKFHDENRAYVRRILRVLWHVYADAGWPGSPVCARAS
jgi:soluble lytic murein transglycosylase-like protein